jgi:hypothetical protein
MIYSLHDVLQDLQAGRAAVATVKPALLKIEVRAHPRGIQLCLHILGEQGSTFRCEHVVSNLHALCAALGIDEHEVRWHVTAQNTEPGDYAPFLIF